MTREVDRERVDIGKSRVQQPFEVRPGPRGLREAVREDEAVGRVAGLVVHQVCSATAWSAILRNTWANVSGSCAPGIAQRPLIT